MPPIFKALTTIMAWILWIFALVMGFSTLVMGIVSEELYNVDKIPPMAYPVLFAVAGFYAIWLLAFWLYQTRLGSPF